MGLLLVVGEDPGPLRREGAGGRPPRAQDFRGLGFPEVVHSQEQRQGPGEGGAGNQHAPGSRGPL